MCKLTLEYDVKKIIKSVFLLSEEEYVKLPCYERSLLSKICKNADCQHVDDGNSYKKDHSSIDEDVSPQQSNDLIINIVIRNDMSFNQDLVDNDITDDVAHSTYYDFCEDFSELNYEPAFLQSTEREEPLILFDDPANVILITPEEYDIESNIDMNDNMSLQKKQFCPELPSSHLHVLNSQFEEIVIPFCEAENNVNITFEKFSNEMTKAIKSESDKFTKKDYLRLKNKEACKKYRIKKKENIQQLHDAVNMLRESKDNLIQKLTTLGNNSEESLSKSDNRNLNLKDLSGKNENYLARYCGKYNNGKTTLTENTPVPQLIQENEILKKTEEQPITRSLLGGETDASTNLPYEMCFNETPTEGLISIELPGKNGRNLSCNDKCVNSSLSKSDNIGIRNLNFKDLSGKNENYLARYCGKYLYGKTALTENTPVQQLIQENEIILKKTEEQPSTKSLLGDETDALITTTCTENISTDLPYGICFNETPTEGFISIELPGKNDRDLSYNDKCVNSSSENVDKQQLHKHIDILREDEEQQINELALLGDDPCTLITSTDCENMYDEVPRELYFDETMITKEIKSEELSENNFKEQMEYESRSSSENVPEQLLQKQMDILMEDDKDHIKHELALIEDATEAFKVSNDFNTIGTLSLKIYDSFSMNSDYPESRKDRKGDDKRQRNNEACKRYRTNKKMYEQQLQKAIDKAKKDKEDLIQELSSLGDDIAISLPTSDHEDINESATLELEHCKQTSHWGKKNKQQNLINACKRYRIKKKNRQQDSIKSMERDQELVCKLRERLKLLKNK